MSTQNNTVLAPYIQRARKVLQHEQRTNHQDQAIKPGGMEIFVGRWADEMKTACKQAGLDPHPVYRITEHLEGYRRQDPMQRAANIRAVLAILNELEGHTPPPSTPIQAKTPAPTSITRTEKIEGKSSSATQPKPPGPPIVATTITKNSTAPATPASAPQTLPKQAPQVQNPIPLEAGMSAGHTALT